MLINRLSQQTSVLSLPRRAGVAVSQVTARATTARPRTAQHPAQHPATAAASSDVVQTADAPATAAAAARAEGSNPGADSSSAVTRERSTSIILTTDTDCTKTAMYLVSTLIELGRGAVVTLKCAGAVSLVAAYKTLGKAAERVPALDSDSVLTFEMRSRLVQLDGSSDPAQDDEQQQQQQQRRRRVTEFFVRLEPADLYCAVRPDVDADRSDPFNGPPMRIRTDTLWSKVSDHACNRTKLAPEGFCYAVAQFAILPGPELRQRAQLLTRGLTAAQQQLREQRCPGLVFTVERSVDGVQIPARQQQGQGDDAGDDQQQQHVGDSGAEDAAQQQQQPEERSSSSSDGSDVVPMKPLTMPSYTVKAFCRQLRTERKSSAARSSRRSSSAARDSRRSSGSAGDEQQGKPGAARRGSRPGYVEVPAAEWASLREQLEVVPHLTQQLQTMTHQHEQLLSLLAAQQQGGDAGAAAAEAAQQQQ